MVKKPNIVEVFDHGGAQDASATFFIHDGDRFFGAFLTAKTAARFARETITVGPNAKIIEVHGWTNGGDVVEYQHFRRLGVPPPNGEITRQWSLYQ